MMSLCKESFYIYTLQTLSPKCCLFVY
uniref:Uncharacterized protein n=1 Tax=Anguilla anguilla TaxID=7936 RepID=A0A0E9VTB2_ANGAN